MKEAKKPSYKYCVVPSCKNTSKSTPDKVFFSIPRNEKVRKQWCKIMRRDKISALSSLYCCEDHFNVQEDTANYVAYNIMKQQGEKIRLQLKKGVVPHMFMCRKQNLPSPIKRMGAIKRERLAVVNEAFSEFADKSSNVLDIEEPPQASHYEVRSSTSYTKICDVIKAKPSTSCSENSDVNQAEPNTSHFNVYGDHQAKPSTSHIEDKLHSDKTVQVDVKVKFRSKGVNVNIPTENESVALSLFPVSSHNIGTSPIKTAADSNRELFTDNPLDGTSISSYFISDYEPSCSSEFNSLQDDSEDEKCFKKTMHTVMLAAIEKQPKMLIGLHTQSYHVIKLLSENIPLPIVDILITLKKIKLNESFSILALQFGYAQSTISRKFFESIPLIAAKMKDFIYWATPSEIHRNLPIPFRSKYANVVSIIDCLEIQIEKPSNALHQSLTWSQYKKCNTLKYLISYTPNGLVNFISEGYGGGATDVMIVQDCDYLECLPPNKAVMTDRGFRDLSCLLEAKKCTLIRPPFVSKSSSSSKDEVKKSKRIAELRTHIEMVVNRLREFHMLLPHACVDHTLIPIIDQVIIVTCGLINMEDVKKIN